MDEKDRRLYLHGLLKVIPNVNGVYYQPPSNTRLVYPCIIYSWDRNDVKHADDQGYLTRRGYTVTIVDSNPDSIIPGIFQRNFTMAKLDRTFTSDNMHHWVYDLYF